MWPDLLAKERRGKGFDAGFVIEAPIAEEVTGISARRGIAPGTFDIATRSADGFGNDDGRRLWTDLSISSD
jgi:hypothetical protein